ncbi:MAG: YggS family pyridoxal phosphate-dependent enzyme [Candidatus Nanopelagicales bacterium]
MSIDRRNELARGLVQVRERIAAACLTAGRSTADVDLLVVTKTFPATDLELLAELGCTDVGESRDQEARAKRDTVRASLRWHMIGQVQRKKARHVAAWADVIESVDRPELADALQTAALGLGRTIDVLLQVSLDPVDRPDRGGVGLGGLQALAAHVLGLSALRLRGVMAVAPLAVEPKEAFTVLAQAHQELLRLAPEATIMSAGMSQDLEAAISCGATQVRIGGAILGNRPPLK